MKPTPHRMSQELAKASKPATLGQSCAWSGGAKRHTPRHSWRPARAQSIRMASSCQTHATFQAGRAAARLHAPRWAPLVARAARTRGGAVRSFFSPPRGTRARALGPPAPPMHSAWLGIKGPASCTRLQPPAARAAPPHAERAPALSPGLHPPFAPPQPHAQPATRLFSPRAPALALDARLTYATRWILLAKRLVVRPNAAPTAVSLPAIHPMAAPPSVRRSGGGAHARAPAEPSLAPSLARQAGLRVAARPLRQAWRGVVGARAPRL